MYMSVPRALRRLDSKPRAHVPEPVLVQVLWALLVYFPTLRRLLDLPADAEWWLGGPGVGDLTARVPGQPIAAHVEVKSASARASYGTLCPHDCGVYASQLAHMAHDADADIVLLVHSGRVPAARTMAAEAGVADRVRVVTFAQLADVVEQALAEDGAPSQDLLECLLDVEDVA